MDKLQCIMCLRLRSVFTYVFMDDGNFHGFSKAIDSQAIACRYGCANETVKVSPWHGTGSDIRHRVMWFVITVMADSPSIYGAPWGSMARRS